MKDWCVNFKFLKVFYNVTELLFGVYYSTVHLVLYQLFNISETFAYYKNTELFGLIVYKMEAKFKSY